MIIERYIDLDKLFLELSPEKPQLELSAVCYPYRRINYKNEKKKETIHYKIEYRDKKYFIQQFFFSRELKSDEKLKTKWYSNKEKVKEDLKKDLAVWNFKDKDSDINFESNMSFEEWLPFDFWEQISKREVKKVSELILLWTVYSYKWLLWFWVPISTKTESRYDTVLNWVDKDGWVQVIENLPIRGLRRLWVTSRYSTSNKFIEYFDPRGFIFQLSASDSNQLTKDLEELWTSLEETECVWDCNWRSPSIYPVDKYNIQYTYCKLTSEQEKKYLRWEKKNSKIKLRLGNLFLGKYIVLDIESIEFPWLFIVFNLESKKLMYLSHSKMIELYTSNLNNLDVEPILDETDELSEKITEKLINSWKFVTSRLTRDLLEKYE